MLNSTAGSLFCLADWLMWTSIVLNLTLCAKPDCGLERCGDNGDGNVVAETMLFAPALLGGEDVCDLWHKCPSARRPPDFGSEQRASAVC